MQYHHSDDLAQTWGPVVVYLERYCGATAIPRYERREVKPGIIEHEIETNALMEDINKCIQMMYQLKSEGLVPCFISATFKFEDP